MREPSPEVDLVARRVIGAAIEVHRTLGPGFLEILYEQALCHELGLQAIQFDRQVPIDVNYKGVPIGQSRLDLLVEGCVIVELKAVDQLGGVHMAQVLAYLRATGLELGLLINFNVPVLRAGIKRVVNS